MYSSHDIRYRGPVFPKKVFWFFWRYKIGTLARNGFPAGNYMFKVNNRNTRTRWEICSKLTAKISERRYWRRSGIIIVNFEQISDLVLVFPLLTLSRYMPTGLMLSDLLLSTTTSSNLLRLTIHSNLALRY